MHSLRNDFLSFKWNVKVIPTTIILPPHIDKLHLCRHYDFYYFFSFSRPRTIGDRILSSRGRFAIAHHGEHLSFENLSHSVVIIDQAGRSPSSKPIRNHVHKMLPSFELIEDDQYLQPDLRPIYFYIYPCFDVERNPAFACDWIERPEFQPQQ